ncbi:hypothetical protein [Paractinoplanes abujensis]|uniref:Uncharacterized protein n=1 Tax=Paractinoplanes abujensis TaxID=882441 RepID=A0A7W7CVU2_9ACTN|nr:hypothetical protein [Actinoplanes abujensis]MBB4695597.1 hypothetical protein [Actinoplanes abujensis]
MLMTAVQAEPLIIADSHSLNSPMLRSLFAEANGSRFRSTDLGDLLRRGDIRISRRDTLNETPVTSFRQIQADHREREVVNVPPDSYGDWLDEVTDGHVIEFSLDTVAANFKKGLLARIEQRLTRLSDGTPDAYRRVLATMRDWAEDQPVVFYKSVRKEYERLLAGENADRNTVEATDFVERAASAAYHVAVPMAIAIAVSGPRNDDLVDLPPWISTTNSTSIAPSLINDTVWQHIPVEAVTEILDLGSRQTMLRELAEAKLAGNAPVEPLVGSFVAFADDLHDIVEETFAGDSARDEEVRYSIVGADLKAEISAVRDESNGASGVRLHAAVSGSRTLFDNLHMPVLGTSSGSYIDQDDRSATPNTRVIAGMGITVGD